MNQARSFSAFLTSVLATSVVALTLPVQALQVSVNPIKPRLGDTLSVVVKPEAQEKLTQAPQVVLAGKSYPVFPGASNQWRSLIPTTPLEKYGRRSLKVTGAGKTRNLLVWVGNRAFPTQSIWLPPGKDSEGTDYEFDRVDAFKALVSPQKLWSGPFRRPNQGPITTGYGLRRYYNGVFANDYYHRGIDYAGGTGSPVVAPAAARVALVGLESKGFKIHGNAVGLDHGQGVVSIYMHLSRIDVKEGETVKPGQVIGAVGSTGAVTGPHLHWGLYVGGQAVDPTPWRYRGFN